MYVLKRLIVIILKQFPSLFFSHTLCINLLVVLGCNNIIQNLYLLSNISLLFISTFTFIIFIIFERSGRNTLNTFQCSYTAYVIDTGQTVVTMD